MTLARKDEFVDMPDEDEQLKIDAFAAAASVVSREYIFSIFFIVYFLLHFQSCLIHTNAVFS